MTEQTSALKSKENNNVASKQPKPPMQKAAPGTTKRIFGYIFQYKWRVARSSVHSRRSRSAGRIVTIPAVADRHLHSTHGWCHQP